MIIKWKKTNKLIGIWVSASVIFAFIIHCLFSIYPTNRWFSAKWSAGEILTYVSTVSLGLLAVWQNQKLQEENDKSQERLEKLVSASNNISVINKIIQYEMENLQRLRNTMDIFSKACDPQTIASKYGENIENDISIMTAMSILENELDNSFFALGRELRIDFDLKKNDNAVLKKEFALYYREGKELIRKIEENPQNAFDREIVELSKRRDAFAKERENYLVEQEKKLNRLLYDNMKLEDITKFLQGI